MEPNKYSRDSDIKLVKNKIPPQKEYSFCAYACKEKMPHPKSKKALVLFSGGLDSILACKIIESAGLMPTALHLKSVFFDSQKPLFYAQKNKIKLITLNFSQAHLDLVKNPRFGYGKNLNPCLDCRLAMLKIAFTVFQKEKFNVLATGEVMAQRPMSQNKNAFLFLEKRSDLSGQILRPLSAQILPPTIYQKQNLIDIKKMESISGRGRKKQLALANQYNIKHFPSPAGGCLLTDPGYSQKLKQFLTISSTIKIKDASLLKKGRIFFFKKNLIIIGRNKKENEILIAEWNQKTDTLIYLKDFLGPFILIRNLHKIDLNLIDLKKIGGLLGYYYPRLKETQKITIVIKNKKDLKTVIVPNRKNLD